MEKIEELLQRFRIRYVRSDGGEARETLFRCGVFSDTEGYGAEPYKVRRVIFHITCYQGDYGNATSVQFLLYLSDGFVAGLSESAFRICNQ